MEIVKLRCVRILDFQTLKTNERNSPCGYMQIKNTSKCSPKVGTLRSLNEEEVG